MCRKDTDNASGSPTEFIGTPGNAFQQGLINQGMNIGFYSVVGVTPFESHDFLQNFRITKVKTYVLGLGQTKILREKTGPFSVQNTQFNDPESQNIGGLSRFNLFIGHGHAIRETTTPGVTLSQGGFGMVHLSKYTLRNSQDYLSDRKLSFFSGVTLLTGTTSFQDYSIGVTGQGTAMLPIVQ